MLPNPITQILARKDSMALTDSQVVAAAVTFGVSLVMWVLSGAGQIVSDAKVKALLEYASVLTHLQKFLQGKVASWQVPENWAFIDEVPKTSVGKYDKKVLRARFAEGGLPVQRTKAPGEK